MPVPPILDICKLRHRYGRVEALRGIDLRIDEPGIYGFLGPNGAGKTTTIKLVAGLLCTTSGHVFINGVDAQSDPVAARRGLGVMTESARFYENLTGRDNLRVLARLSGMDNPGHIAGLLERVGLRDKADQKVRSYSRGMCQRLGLATALLGDPRLVILDEPTNGLDPSGIADMRRWLIDLARAEGRAILLSSHRMGEVERTCDRVVVIDRGLIIADGPTDTIVRPKNSIIIRTARVDDAHHLLKTIPEIDRVEPLDRDSLRVHGGSASTSRIVRLLAEHNIDLMGISEEHESLEDAFFRLVGERHHVA